jgi:hypothetical protein
MVVPNHESLSGTFGEAFVARCTRRYEMVPEWASRTKMECGS